MSSQSVENSGAQLMNGLREFVCLIKDNEDTTYAARDSKGNKRTYEKVLLERKVPCKCKGKQHPTTPNARPEIISTTEQTTPSPPSYSTQ
jgi:hypothetical protein